MTKAQRRLAAHFLREAADEYSNHGCNDVEYPPWFTKKDRAELVEICNATGDHDPIEASIEPEICTDFVVMLTLAHLLDGQ
jgi:hypothetical protein